MPNINKDYLRYDAFSIKQLLTQKLSEDTNYTDQIYAGSDLSVFIDIVSNAYQVMKYYINQAGAESIAQDSQFYENINRIVKFLDYHPNGYTTAVTEGIVTGVPDELDNTILPAYSTVDTGKKDTNGFPIMYSTVDYYYVYDDNSVDAGLGDNDIPFYNGIWKMYEIPFVAEGLPYETFLLNNLYSDTDKESYVSFPYLHAFVKRGDEWMIFKPSPTSLFINREEDRVYTSEEKVFELRLNEFKQVEIKFGDGIYAKQLQDGDVVYVAYLKSNGPDGEIAVGGFGNSSIRTTIAGFSNEILKGILVAEFGNLVNNDTDLSIPVGITVDNIAASSSPVEEETVDQIKEFAPNHFKSGGRLLTKDDFEFFVRSKYYKDIVDVTVHNNWAYLKTFLRWLYNAGIIYHEGDGGYYLGPTLKSRDGYEWADSCDFNNIYIWMKMKAGFNIPRTEILKNIQMTKVLTGEVIFLNPIIVNFVPCAYGPYDSVIDWDPTFENYVEIELSPSTTESPARVRSRANSVIVDYFATKNQTLGAKINLNELESRLDAIDGVNRVRTVYKSGTELKIVNGLQFMMWSTTILSGEDRQVVNGNITLEDFQFPQLLETTMINRIKVITESAYQTNEVEY